MPANFVMLVPVPSTAGDDAGPPEAGLAARVAAGPGLWEDEEWLADLRREGLPESLLACGAVAAAAAAVHGHRQERALNAEVTALCLVTGALFPVLGYDSVLALVFGMPGVPVRPATPVPTGPAFSKARERHGEAPARAMFELDAARGDIPAGEDGTAFGLEITQIDGTTLELFGDPPLARSSGSPRPARGRCCDWSGCCTPGPAGGRPRRSAATTTGRTPWPTSCRTRSAPGSSTSPTAGSSPWTAVIRFSGAGADLLWRVKNGAKCVPFGPSGLLKDGSELVFLRERTPCAPAAARSPATTPSQAAGHRRPAGLLHRPDPHPRRQRPRPPGSGSSPPCWTRALPRPRDRGAVRREMADGNRVLAFEKDRPRRWPCRCAAGRRNSPGRKPGCAMRRIAI